MTKRVMSELTQLEDGELGKKLKDSYLEYNKLLALRHRMGGSANSGRIREIRKNVARILGVKTARSKASAAPKTK